MSERGSFVTEYIYCKTCFDAAWEGLKGHDKYLMSTRIPAWGDNGTVGINGEASAVLPIVAGKMGGLSSGEEFVDFEIEIAEKIQERMCSEHRIRIAILSDCAGSRIYSVSRETCEVVAQHEPMSPRIIK